MKNSIFNAVCKTRYLALLTVLLFTCGKALGQVTVEDLNFGTPAVSEDFNSCTGSKVQGSGSGAWTGTISNYGNFTNGYTGKTASVSFEIAAASSPMTSKHLKLVSLSNGTGVSFSRSFSTTGAFSFTVKKDALVTVGLNAVAVNGNMDTKANCAVMLKITGGNIQVHTGTGGSWVTRYAMPTSPDLVTITVVYNTTNSATTYGNSLSLPAKTAHLFVNGTRVESEGNAVNCTLYGTSPAHFWVASNQSGTMLIDDIKIYDALPTAGSCTAPSSVTVAPTVEAGNYGYRYTTGQDIKLTATATGGSGSYSYQWQKYSGTWDDLDGKTSQDLVISNCTSSDGGQYRCVVSTGATCSLASDGYNVRVWTLNGNYSGSGFTENAITWTGESTGTVTLNLNASSTYDFKVYGNGDGKYYGCNSGISVDADSWTFRTSDGNCSLSTGAIGAGEYTFAINIANADDNNIAVSVTYPRKKIYVVPNGYTDDDAKLSIYYWRSSTNGWSSFLTTGACTDGKYYAEIPGWAQCFSIVRLNSDATVGTFDKKWNQTVDITANASYDQYTVNTWCSGTGCKEGVTAGTFSEPTFTISFAGGSGATGSTDSHTGIVCDANQTLRPNGFSKEGHSFSCWHADVDVKVNGSTVTAGNAIAGGATIQNIHSNIALTAQWNIESYTLTWNLAGGTVTTAGTGAAVNATGSPSSSVAYGSPITVPGVAKEGYNFTGWNTTPLATMPAVNTTYTAQWTIKSYTVTWSVEGTATGTTNVNHGSQVSSLPSTPVSTCDGEFVGWTTSADAVYDKNVTDNHTTTPTVFTNVAGSPTITGDITFYAVFKKRMED